MINAIHTLIYSNDAAATRAFFRDVLKMPTVDAGEGWLIFALPPAELGIHPTEPGVAAGHHTLYLMCDDVRATVAALTKKGVRFTRPVADMGWGLLTTLALPGGGQMGLYQPRHRTAVKLKKPRPAARASGKGPAATRLKRKGRGSKQRQVRTARTQGRRR